MKRRTCIRLKWYYRKSICLSHEFIDESHCQFEIPYLHPWLPKEIDRQENQVEEQRTVSAQTLSLCFSSLFIFIPALQVSFSKTVLIWVYPWSTATAISQLPEESSLLFIFSCIQLDASSFSPEVFIFYDDHTLDLHLLFHEYYPIYRKHFRRKKRDNV